MASKKTFSNPAVASMINEVCGEVLIEKIRDDLLECFSIGLPEDKLVYIQALRTILPILEREYNGEHFEDSEIDNILRKQLSKNSTKDYSPLTAIVMRAVQELRNYVPSVQIQAIDAADIEASRLASCIKSIKKHISSFKLLLSKMTDEQKFMWLLINDLSLLDNVSISHFQKLIKKRLIDESDNIVSRLSTTANPELQHWLDVYQHCSQIHNAI